jgi:hypothetical protein
VKLKGELLMDEFGRFTTMKNGGLVWNGTIVDGTCRLELIPYLEKAAVAVAGTDLNGPSAEENRIEG